MRLRKNIVARARARPPPLVACPFWQVVKIRIDSDMRGRR